MDKAQEYPKMLYRSMKEHRIVHGVADEDAARDAGFGDYAEMSSEKQPAAPVAESLAPVRSAAGEGGVATTQGGAAADSPKRRRKVR